MPVDIRKALKKYVPHLLQAKAENLNEADTVQRIVKVLEEVLDYSAMTEVSREKQVKGTYVDLAIKIDGVFKLLIEVKSAASALRDRHIEQAERYAAEGNVQWVLLTNGVCWNLYHLTFDEGIEYVKAFEVNLETAPLDQAATLLGLLHRQAIKKGEHEEFWRRRAALHPASIGKALFCEEVLRFVRRDIRKREGILVDEEDIARAIHDLFSAQALEQMGPLKIRRRRAGKQVRGPLPEATAAKEAEKPPEKAVDGTVKGG